MTDWLKEWHTRSSYVGRAHEVSALILNIPCTVPRELFDFLAVLLMGIEKYGADSWLKDGKTFHGKENEDHVFHHLAALQRAQKPEDYIDESGLDHALHGAARLLMGYTLRRRDLDA